MEKQHIMEKIRSAATKDGKISCPTALRLANETDLSPKALGELLNEMKIKIDNCQLGCFPK